MNDIIKGIRENFDADIKILEREYGKKKVKQSTIFVRIRREDFRKFVEYLFTLQQYPHFSVISATDLGEEVELVYHFALGYGEFNGEKMVSVGVTLPKSALKIESITDLIPGALISEREIHEMVGVEFIGLKDTRHFFLPENWPEGKYPWRRDETFPEEMLNKLYETWKEVDKNE